MINIDRKRNFLGKCCTKRTLVFLRISCRLCLCALSFHMLWILLFVVQYILWFFLDCLVCFLNGSMDREYNLMTITLRCS